MALHARGGNKSPMRVPDNEDFLMSHYRARQLYDAAVTKAQNYRTQSPSTLAFPAILASEPTDAPAMRRSPVAASTAARNGRRSISPPSRPSVFTYIERIDVNRPRSTSPLAPTCSWYGGTTYRYKRQFEQTYGFARAAEFEHCPRNRDLPIPYE
jgi:hypothetical protein